MTTKTTLTAIISLLVVANSVLAFDNGRPFPKQLKGAAEILEGQTLTSNELKAYEARLRGETYTRTEFYQYKRDIKKLSKLGEDVHSGFRLGYDFNKDSDPLRVSDVLNQYARMLTYIPDHELNGDPTEYKKVLYELMDRMTANDRYPTQPNFQGPMKIFTRKEIMYLTSDTWSPRNSR